MGTSKNPDLRASAARLACLPHFIPTDGTTDITTSHLTNPAKDAGQVIGYSHSTKSPKNGYQVAGYAALRKKISCLHITNMRRDEIFSAQPLRGLPAYPFSTPCIWANSEFLEAPQCYQP
jgi:hypothetical protein